MNLEAKLDVIERSGYRGSKLAVLSKLARICNTNNCVMTTVQTLADAVNLTVRATQYILTALKQDGVLAVSYQAGANLENLYSLNFQALTERSKQTR